jgi:hypothetical protein
MNFKPCSEKEIADRKLWAKAVYPFEIVAAAEKVSQSGGNPMIELKVKISRADGATRTIWDYLLEKTPEKLLHCCKATGLLDRYESGSLADTDFQGKRGQLRLGVEKKKGCPDRNVIADYVCNAGAWSGSGFFAGTRHIRSI